MLNFRGVNPQPIIHQNLNGTLPTDPQEVARATRYSGLGVRSVVDDLKNKINLTFLKLNDCSHSIMFTKNISWDVVADQSYSYGKANRNLLVNVWLPHPKVWNNYKVWIICILYIWVFPKMVVPPKHPKMIIFSRKIDGCWVPPF